MIIKASNILKGSDAVYQDTVLHFIELFRLLFVFAFYLEIFDDKTVDWMLQTVEKVVTDAKGHRIGHSKAFKEVEVELFPLIALLVMIGLMMDLNFIGKRFFNTLHPHAIRPKERRLRNPTLLLAQRQHALQKLVVLQHKSISDLVVIRILLIEIIHFDCRMQANQRIRFYSIMFERLFILQKIALKYKQLVLRNNPQQFMDALLKIQNFFVWGRFNYVLFSLPKYTDIHFGHTAAPLVNLLHMQNGIIGEAYRFHGLRVIFYMPSFEENAIAVRQLDFFVVDQMDELVKGLAFLKNH